MPDRAPLRRRGPVAIGLILVVGVLAACGGPSAGPTAGSPTASAAARLPVSSASASPSPAAPIVPEVPVQSSSIGAVAPASAVPPVSLSIGSVGIDVPIDPVGVAADGQMEIPPLAERAGWYRFGAAPGQAAGTTVIAAHVDSIASAGLGPFVRLRDVAAGDVVDVVLAGGTTVQYAVSSVERIAKPAVGWPEIFRVDGDPRLILITCGGSFNRNIGHYSDNVIVTARRVGA